MVEVLVVVLLMGQCVCMCHGLSKGRVILGAGSQLNHVSCAAIKHPCTGAGWSMTT